MNFKDYMFLMLGIRKVRLTDTPKIRKITEPTKSDKSSIRINSKGNHESSESIPLIYNIVIIATWFMVIASLLSLVAIILFEILGKKAPSILSQLLLVMVGYLGGVIASYVRFVTPNKKTK